MQEFGAQQSPQGIAALSMGNPAPLQQRVQQAGKDPQTGLPKDLVDALALNIVTNEQDAAKRQMAMQQLQQAAGPTGQMPTVVQSLQQQAQQKMAAMQQQAMQQAQAQQAQARQGGIAQAPQQPQQQAGIDRLPAEFAMAGGGIVSFAKGDLVETPYDPETATRREDYQETPVAYESLPQKLMYEAMQKNPQQEAANYKERLQKEIGAPDTSQYDRLIQELESRKQKMNAPASGMDALMSYLSDIANAGRRGQKWYESGAAGAAMGAQRQKENEAQQFELTKQGIDIAQKKADADRAWKEKLFGAYDAELKRVGDHAYNAAIAQGKNEMDAEKLRQDAIENEKTRQNNLLMERERGITSRAVASAPGQTERMVARIQQLQKIGTPEALKQAEDLKVLFQTFTSGAASVGHERNNRLLLESLKKTHTATLKDVMATDEEKAEARAAIADIDKQIAGLGPGIASAPTPVVATPLPPNATPDTLVDGQVYSTAQGKGRWNKATQKFVSVP